MIETTKEKIKRFESRLAEIKQEVNSDRCSLIKDDVKVNYMSKPAYGCLYKVRLANSNSTTSSGVLKPRHFLQEFKDLSFPLKILNQAEYKTLKKVSKSNNETITNFIKFVSNNFIKNYDFDEYFKIMELIYKNKDIIRKYDSLTFEDKQKIEPTKEFLEKFCTKVVEHWTYHFKNFEYLCYFNTKEKYMDFLKKFGEYVIELHEPHFDNQLQEHKKCPIQVEYRKTLFFRKFKYKIDFHYDDLTVQDIEAFLSQLKDRGSFRLSPAWVTGNVLGYMYKNKKFMSKHDYLVSKRLFGSSVKTIIYFNDRELVFIAQLMSGHRNKITEIDLIS